MARRIAEGGFPLAVWARRAQSVEPFRALARIAASPAELGALSDVVGVCVVADGDVEDVLLGPDGIVSGMAPGAVVAIHSTVHPETCSRVAEAAAARGVSVVDAPVSGGGPAAGTGELLVMVGGAQRDVARCRPVFETFGRTVLHLGALGSGQVAKLLNNLVFTAQLAVAFDTFSFAERLGVDRGALAAVLTNGSGGSRAATILASSDFDLGGLRGALPLLSKDVGRLHDLARAGHVVEPALLVELARRTFAELGGESTAAAKT